MKAVTFWHRATVMGAVWALLGLGVQAGVQVVGTDQTSVVLELRVDSLQVIPLEGEHEQVTLYLDGCGTMSQPGRPVLPVTGTMVGVPPEAPVSLQVLHVDYREQGTWNLPVEPEQGEKVATAGWYPQEFAALGEVGFVREQRVAQVLFFPVRVNQATGKAQVARLVRVAVRFEQQQAAQGVGAEAGAEESAFEPFFRSNLANYAQARQWRRVPTAEAVVKSSRSTRSAQVFKIVVEKDGFYEVRGRDLERAGAVLRGLDPRAISLSNKGRSVPVWVTGARDGSFDPEDAIRFYGEFNRGDHTYFSPYTPANVYWLALGEGSGAHMVEVDGGLYAADPIRPASARHTAHFEEDQLFERLLLVADATADHWFWKQLQPGAPQNLVLRLEKPAGSGLVRVRVMMRGLTYPSYANPDHHVTVKLNGYVVGDVKWDGQAAHLMDNAAVPGSLLNDGDNVLTFELPGDTGAGDLDLVLLDWVEVVYERRLEASGNKLELRREQGRSGEVVEYTVSGFTRPDVLIIDALGRRFTNALWQAEGSGYRVTFQDAASVTTTYYFVPSDGFLSPVAIVRDTPSALRDPANRADYLIITHADFVQEASRLADHRRAQGFVPMVVDVEDVYDEFGNGSMDPAAIRRFLQYAYSNWAPPRLTYVLLVGDCTYGYDKEVARRWKVRTYVPTMLEYTTTWGVLSSDNYFACVSGDDVLPDLYVGRLPVASAEEAGAVIAKIIQYERYPLLGQWRRQLGLITGTGTATRNEFEMNADYLQRNCTPPEIRVRRLSTDTRSPHMGSTEELVKLFEEGTVIMNFIGHGGGGVFSDEELFQIDDVKLLKNTMKFPVLFSLTCFIGYFDSPTKASLGEELLRAPARGIVAHFGSAGRARLYGDQLLNVALFKSLFVNGRRRVGQVTTEGKLGMLGGGFRYPDEAKSFNLMGDPALRIGLPPTEIRLSLAKSSLSMGDSLLVSGSVAGGLSGLVLLEVVNDADSVVAEKVVQVSNGRFEACLAEVTSGFAQHWQEGKGPGVVRAYFWNEQTDGMGAITFRLNELHFVQVSTEPPCPAHLDSVWISAKVAVSPSLSPGGPTAVYTEWSRNSATWTRIDMTPNGEGFYRTVAPIQVEGGARVYYRIVAEYSASAAGVLVSQTFSYEVARAADIAVKGESMVVAGVSSLQVSTTITNAGEVETGPFLVHLFDVTSGASALLAPEIHIGNLPRGADTTVTFVCKHEVSGWRTLRVVADSARAVREQNRANNAVQRTRWIVPQATGTGDWAIAPDVNFSLSIPPQAMAHSTAIAVSGMMLQHYAPGASKAKDLVPVRLKDGKSNYLYALVSDDSTISFTSPYHVTMFFDKGDTLAMHAASLGRLKLYAWDARASQWVYLDSQVDVQEAKVSATATALFPVYGLFVNADNQAPTIRVKFEGQTFADGDFVPAKPSIVAIVEDASPVDNELRPVRVVLDAVELAPAEFSVRSASEAPNVLFVGFTPELAPGPHHLQVTAYDVHGNKGIAEVSFVVSEHFTLRSIANHPNPFASETVIAFTLTAEADELQLRIYSTSGRMVRDLSNQVESVVGYTEVVWDGRDEEGDEVANGVYFLKLVAKKGQARIETIEKIARLR
ncbi:MAG: C25 family cysteine peptidase [candidate division KSB1 bacterium]|nr:C25 family cysteine peptidase [candidate division KSB1 bacterium]